MEEVTAQKPAYLVLAGTSLLSKSSQPNRANVQMQQKKNSGLFKAIGEKPVTYKIIDKAGARYFGLPDGRIFAERGWHMVVRCQGKMYDALTGPRGMSWEKYKEFLAKLKIIAIPIRMPD